MQPEIQRHNAIDTRTALNRRNASETQSGPAYRYLAFDPAQFCKFVDDTESPNWECALCGRRIAKKQTFGRKPLVMCLNPAPATPEEQAAVMPVRGEPQQLGGVVARQHRTAPKFGVGFELKKIFRKIDIELPPRCVCNSRVMLLNDIGLDGVEKMRDKVLRWFEDEANKRALPYDETKANKILDMAIRRTKKTALKQLHAAAKKDNG
jgi:hypothetical protein